MRHVRLADGTMSKEMRVEVMQSAVLGRMERDELKVTPHDIAILVNSLQRDAAETLKILQKTGSDPRTTDALYIDCARADRIVEFLETGIFVLVHKSMVKGFER